MIFNDEGASTQTSSPIVADHTGPAGPDIGVHAIAPAMLTKAIAAEDHNWNRTIPNPFKSDATLALSIVTSERATKAK